MTMEKKKPLIKPIAGIRQLFQIGALILTGEWLFVGTFRCPYGIPFMSCGSCPMRVCPGTWLQTWVIWLLVISGLIIGRGFCGWFCPMGTVQDWLGKIPKLKKFKKPKFSPIDRWLKLAKYPMLVITISAFYLINTRFTVPVRASSNWSLEGIRVAWLTYDPVSHIRVIIILAGVVLAIFLTRAWCRYLCPLGALLTIGNKISFLRLKRNPTTCKNCGNYPRECRTYTTPNTADCVICGDCIEGCTHNAIRISIK